MPPTLTEMYLAVKQDDNTKDTLGKVLSDFFKEYTEYTSKVERLDPSANKENAWSSSYTSSQGNDRLHRAMYFKFLKLSAKNVELHIKVLGDRHKAAKEVLAVNSSKGNENLTTEAATKQSLDPKRFNKEKVPSPSRATEDLAVLNIQTLPSLVGIVPSEVSKSLGCLQTFVSALFKVAEETEAVDAVKATTNAILGWEENGVFKNDAEKYARPPTDRDCETDVDQPILHAVVCRIMVIIADAEHYKDSDDDCSVLSQADRGVTMEQSILGSSDVHGKARRIDINVQPHTEHLALRLPTMVHLPLEIKTAPKDTGKFKKRLEKGRSQCVGHLAKKLTHAFHFGGAGVNASAIGVSLTQVSIEVIILKLSGIGTEDVDVSGESTGPIPLGTDPAMEEMHKESFTGSTNETMSGFELLAGALLYADSKGICYDDMMIAQVHPQGQEPLDVKYLGSGAFSNVFKLQKISGQFMKIPLSASREKSLWNEAAILKELAEKEVVNVPKLVHGDNEGLLSDLRATMRDEVSEMKGLRLHGVVGVALSKVPKVFWKSNSKDIIQKVYDALCAAHKHGIYHLDVRPGNIIVDPPKESVMLSDWGCATTDKRLTSFRGCTPYAHDSLLRTGSNTVVKPELDFASLLYTVVHVTKGKLPWLGEFDRPTNVSEANLENRRDAVNKFIEEKGRDVLPAEAVGGRALAAVVANRRRSKRKR